MTETDLLQMLSRGEDSRHQFKRDATNADDMAAKPLMCGHAKQKTDAL